MISAYYFRQNTTTMVPHHLKEDFQWMVDTGTTHVAITLLEQDLEEGGWNLTFMFEEAEKIGLKVNVVPARWGGIVAGSPKVPSLWAVTHPDSWIRKQDGTPLYGAKWGPQCSVHSAEFCEFFRGMLEELITTYPVDGIIWDEPKTIIRMDYSKHAQNALEDVNDQTQQVQGVCNFFDDMGAYCKTLNPDIKLNLFHQAFWDDHFLEQIGAIKNLDYYGLDGRPWSLQDINRTEADHDKHPASKTILGQIDRFLKVCQKNNKQGLALIENHNLTSDFFELMDQRLPEIMSLPLGHLLYYYYPRNVDKPELQMNIIRKHLLNKIKS